MKEKVIYRIISDTDEDKLAKKYKLVINNINPEEYENVRSEYSTAFQAGGMKFGKIVHSLIIFATKK